MTTCATKERSCGRCTAPWSNCPTDGKKPLPENNGKPWTEELDDELSRLFDGGMKKKDLCTHFGRTSGAIESRLERLGKL